MFFTEIPQTISDLGDYYRNLYKGKGFNSKTSDWPPNQIKLNISVILMHYKNGRTQEELMEIAKRHGEGASVIENTASSIPGVENPNYKYLNDIFAADQVEGENSSAPQYVLIEGAPGIGKTMLAKEIAFRWANGELLKEVTILFLLFLRNPELWEVTSVNKLIQFLTHDDSLVDIKVPDCARLLLHSKQFQIAFVFDGFDEYPHVKNPFFCKLIKEQYFPKAVVVCTSRPAASLCLHNHVDRRMGILGFTKEEREKYITISLSDNKDKLIKYLNENPIIDDLCCIPLYLSILMYLFQHGTLPETLTKLNELFVIHTIYRSLNKAREMNTSMESLKDLPNEVYKSVCSLSKLAYEGLRYQKLAFTSGELMHTCPEISDAPDAAKGFGLLEAVPYYSTIGAGENTVFSFLHFTMQEFLAALYVSTLSNSEQLQLLQGKFWDSAFHYMWIMYVGLVGMNHEPFSQFIKQLINVLSRIGFQSNKIKILFLFQCFIEANSINLLSSNLFSGKIAFSQVSFSSHQFLSIISFLSKSNVQWKALTFNQCRVLFGKDMMNSLKSFVINNNEKMQALSYVDLCNNSSGLSPWVVFCAVIKYSLVADLTLHGGTGAKNFSEELKDSLQYNTTLKSLTVCDIGFDDLEILTDAIIKCSNSINNLSISNRIVSLEVNNNVLLSVAIQNGRVLTLNVLHDNVNNSSSETVNLSNQNLFDHEVICVMFGLQSHSIITVLDISNNHISDTGAKFIVACLLKNKVITKLIISNNEISSKAMAEIILESSILMLDASKNHINDYGEEIGAAIKANNTLQELNMSYCQISPVGVHFIAEGLCENTSLQKLDISTNKLFDDGAIAICKCLENNLTLRYLDMSYNKITNTGAKEVAKAVKVNANLYTLDISGNRIASEGVVAILKAIQAKSQFKAFVQFNNVTKLEFHEISELIKEFNRSLEIHASWTDIISHNLVAIFDYHYFNVHPQSELKATGEIGLSWPVKLVNDTNYAVELISTCLKNDSTLIELDLWDIKLTSLGIKKIAEALQVNKTLRKLDISSQSIDDDGIIAISKSLKNNTTLQDLNFARATINGKEIKQFLNSIEMNTGLKKLNLSSVWSLTSSLGALCCCIRNNTALQELNLSSIITLLHVFELEELTTALHDNTTLQKLIFSNTAFIRQGRIISNLLRYNRTLLELDVSNCQITHVELKEIIEGVKANSTLQSLIISRNILQDGGVIGLCECLKVNKTLKKLDLTKTYFKKEGGIQIGMGIIQFNTIQQLNISQNLLSEAMEAIGRYLQDNTSLLDICMSRCDITSVGAKCIAQAIGINTALKVLDISYNQLDDVGIISIANYLKRNNTIQELNLSSTQMSNEGAVQIAEVLCANVALQKLDVSHNRSVDDTGVTAIGECLKKNSVLKTLNVSGIIVTNLAAIKFAETLKVNTSLQTLKFFQEGGYSILEFIMTVLDAVQFNTSIINLELPNLYVTEVGNKIRCINQDRSRQGVHALCTNLDCSQIYSTFNRLSYL